ncbi:hypothetical protein H7F33_15555 [Pedobacter sp. PAMC26386]|nr:hypothetical protein H7F33_15555 [Pedobacter sp. PAMC26386]
MTRSRLSRFLCFTSMLLFIFISASRFAAQQCFLRIDETKISTDSLNNYLPELMRRAKVPGLAITVFNQNKIIYTHTFWYSRADQKKH